MNLFNFSSINYFLQVRKIICNFAAVKEPTGMNFVPNAFSVFPTLYPAHFTAGMMCCRRFSFCFCDSFRAKARLYMLPE